MNANQNIIGSIAANRHPVTNAVFGPMTGNPVTALAEMPGALEALLSDLTARRAANQAARDMLADEAANEERGKARRRVEDCIRKHPGALVAALASLIESGYIE